MHERRGPHRLSLVDTHSHGVLHGELGIGSFERYFGAAAGAVPGGRGAGSLFDTRAGLALLRWCPPLLGLEPRCPAVRYLARRREMGAFAAGRALLRATGIGTFLVDPAGPLPAPHGAGGAAGDGEEDVTSPGELAQAAGGRGHEIVGLDRLAVRAAETASTVRALLTSSADALHTATRRGAVAFVCDAAAVAEPAAPGIGEVQRAAGRWLTDRGRRTRPVRRNTADPTLLRHLLWAALTTGRPLQLRCADPTPLAGLLEAVAGTGTVVLLPRRPHHRAAARLAAAFPHVYADVGPDPRHTLGEAPFGKLLFSTGAWGLPEVHVLRVRQFERGMERLLAEWVAEGECTTAQAHRIGALVAGGTARRIYRLEDEAVAVG